MKTFLFLLLLVAGGYIYYQHGQIKELGNTLANLQAVYSSSTTTGPTVEGGITAATWEGIAPDKVAAVLGTTTAPIDAQSISFSTTVDLTGDTVPEGVYKIGSGATGSWFSVLKLDSARNPTALKTKEKDGAIGIVSLTQSISATSSTNYKLLPDEHAYYTTETVNQSTTSTPKLSCSLNAYSWNVLTGEFEYSQTLTDKYTPEVCK